MLFSQALAEQNRLRFIITTYYRKDEADTLRPLIDYAAFSDAAIARIQEQAATWITIVRNQRLTANGMDAFMHQYNLSSEEGIALMCVAEALLRIPDKVTRDKLVRDKLSLTEWQKHVGQSHSLFVNAATWGLMLTGNIYQWGTLNDSKMTSSLKRLMVRSGEPIIRQAVAAAMRILGKQFVMGVTIDKAIRRATSMEKKGYRYSYDMLGEAAKTEHDAERYLHAYMQAIHSIGQTGEKLTPEHSPGISVKLSALYSRYEFAKREDIFAILLPRLMQLATLAKDYNIGLTVDAEEAERLDISLDLIEAVCNNASLKDWQGFGLALQAYQKRAFYVIDWLAELAQKTQRRIMLRLVKGAYWDSEIKISQERGFEGYPVFTRKISTDVSYLACAKKIIAYGKCFYPQFATHNAYSVAAILEMLNGRKDFEFQCLHGMGQSLYDNIIQAGEGGIACRIYAPVGSHEDLLPYLVRRLLENGANSSFVNRIVDASEPIENLIADPISKLKKYPHLPNLAIPLPLYLFGTERKNSIGLDLTDYRVLTDLQTSLSTEAAQTWQGGVILTGKLVATEQHAINNPANNHHKVGSLSVATSEQVEQALTIATEAFLAWDLTPAEQRAACLDRAADLLEQRRSLFMALAINEAGKTIIDALAEVREAVDFCRYYAAQARAHFSLPIALPGATGESNRLELHGRGIIACISPWNFPLAIFMGQVTAALVAGNAVIAKPAAQTPLIASYAVQLLHEAGIPNEVLHLLPGEGRVIGAQLIADTRIAGVMFTGSTETARSINLSLANRQGAIVPFIAETGGQNVMIVDSSALPEQVVNDVILSAFGSAGQRCSALRVLFLQEEIADKVITMLQGGMATLKVGDPRWLATDIGPVIDAAAKRTLDAHISAMKEHSKLIYQVALDESITQKGTFVAPVAFEIESLAMLKQEVFGPILHVIRYKSNELDKVIQSINDTGYGLTLGIHTRIAANVKYICERTRVGNTYVNRNMIGAAVGVQPFGGEGLSGTGPKAGGPHYLLRLCTERTVTINTTAAGGNTSLMSLQE